MKRFGWQVVGCSMPAMQRQERRGRQELINALTGQQASWWWVSGGGDPFRDPQPVKVAEKRGDAFGAPG